MALGPNLRTLQGLLTAKWRESSIKFYYLPAIDPVNGRHINSKGLGCLTPCFFYTSRKCPERVAIFIDGSNFYHGLRAMFQRSDVDFEKFSEKLCSGRKQVRTYFYIVPLNQKENPQAYSQQQKFFAYLDKVPYLERRLGRLVRRRQELQCPHFSRTFDRDFHLEKGVDVKIALDMLDMAVKKIYDVAALVSGDGDFSNAIRAVKELGLSVENAYFPRDPSGRTGHSWELMQVCDKFISLTPDFMKDCWRR